jgi:hypothetical protein
MSAGQANVMENKSNPNNEPESGNERILTTAVSEFFEFESEAVTDPAELAEIEREHREDRVERVIFLGVFESESITDSAELAGFHRTATQNRSPPILVDQVDEFIESKETR